MGKVFEIPDLLTQYRVHEASHHLNNIHRQADLNPVGLMQFIEHQYDWVNIATVRTDSDALDVTVNHRWLDCALRAGRISWWMCVVKVIGSPHGLQEKFYFVGKMIRRMIKSIRVKKLASRTE